MGRKKKMGFFDKLKQGLNKTKESFNEKINNVFSNFRKVKNIRYAKKRIKVKH